MILIRRHPRRVLTILFGRSHAASRAEQEVAEVAGHAFVDEEKLADHRLLIIARREPGGAAVFAVPRMNELVREDRDRSRRLVGIG